MSILKAGIDLDIKHHKLAKDVLSRLIILSHDSSHDTLRFVRALTHLDSFDERSHVLHNKLEVRPTLCRQNVEIAVDCNSLKIDSDTKEELHDLDIVVDVLHGLPTIVKNTVASSLFIWLLEHRLNGSSSTNLLMPSEKLDNIVRFRLFRDTLLYLLCTKLESDCFTKIGDILKFAQVCCRNGSGHGYRFI